MGPGPDSCASTLFGYVSMRYASRSQMHASCVVHMQVAVHRVAAKHRIQMSVDKKKKSLRRMIALPCVASPCRARVIAHTPPDWPVCCIKQLTSNQMMHTPGSLVLARLSLTPEVPSYTHTAITTATTSGMARETWSTTLSATPACSWTKIDKKSKPLPGLVNFRHGSPI